MIDIPEHARKEMEDDGITDDEVKVCLKHGSLEIKQVVQGEMRYGKRLELKDKIIVVIYTYRNETTRVVTCYTIRRKKWQNQ